MSNAGEFPSTHWSLVVEAGSASGDAKQRALAAVLKQYLPPLRCHLLYAKRIDLQRCEDLLQSFVADKILEQDLIQLAKEGRGRFRGFLLASLDRFVSNQMRFERAKKRTPRSRVSIEEASLVPDGGTAPDGNFDIEWAREVLAQAIDLMRTECARTRPQLWEVFEVRVLAGTLNDDTPMPYAEMVKRYGFVTPSQAANAVVTANRMFSRLLRTVIGRYEIAPADIEVEIQDLRQALASRGSKRLPSDDKGGLSLR